MSMKNVFITGVTGFIGGQLCSSLLAEGYCIWVLVRAMNKEEAKKRVMTRIERKRGRLGRRLNIVLGDLQKKGLGINDIARKVLSERCNYVIHCAGETRFNKHPYSYEVNISGTKNLINEVAQWYCIGSAGIGQIAFPVK